MSPPTKAVTKSHVVETQHDEMIHDAQMDYYGKRLATCSSDRTIRVFDVVDGEAKGEPDILRGHLAPVWQLSWAHPSFGPILASAAYDGKVLIWKEKGRAALGAPPSKAAAGKGGAGTYGAPPTTTAGSGAAGGKDGDKWEVIKELSIHGASVNSVAWAPFELGPILACASSDSKVSVITFNNDGSTDAFVTPAHPMGATSVSWAPSAVPGSLLRSSPAAAAGASSSGPSNPQQQHQQQQQAGGGIVGVPERQRRLVTGGCDSKVKIWGWREETKEWALEETLDGHSDWVRDVAWAPNTGLPASYIASASQDRTVLIHTRSSPSGPWTTSSLLPAGQLFPETVWRLSWSLAGNVLAVSGGEGKVSLWKERAAGGWECVNELMA